MTRKSIATVLSSLLVALLVTLNAPVVGAEGSCDPADAGTIEQCVELATTSAAVVPVHILSTNGMGQEQFEATEGDGYGQFLVPVPTSGMIHGESDYAPEGYEQMMPGAYTLSN